MRLVYTLCDRICGESYHRGKPFRPRDIFAVLRWTKGGSYENKTKRMGGF